MRQYKILASLLLGIVVFMQTKANYNDISRGNENDGYTLETKQPVDSDEFTNQIGHPFYYTATEERADFIWEYIINDNHFVAMKFEGDTIVNDTKLYRFVKINEYDSFGNQLSSSFASEPALLDDRKGAILRLLDNGELVIVSVLNGKTKEDIYNELYIEIDGVFTPIIAHAIKNGSRQYPNDFSRLNSLYYGIFSIEYGDKSILVEILNTVGPLQNGTLGSIIMPKDGEEYSCRLNNLYNKNMKRVFIGTDIESPLAGLNRILKEPSIFIKSEQGAIQAFNDDSPIELKVYSLQGKLIASSKGNGYVRIPTASFCNQTVVAVASSLGDKKSLKLIAE